MSSRGRGRRHPARPPPLGIAPDRLPYIHPRRPACGEPPRIPSRHFPATVGAMVSDDDHSVYKVCAASAWRDAAVSGAYCGSAVDRRDGFIHLSTSAQLAETLHRYFAGQRDLVLVAVDPGTLGTQLRWEPSRGGDLFPHLYGDLPVSLAQRVTPLDVDADGRPRLRGTFGLSISIDATPSGVHASRRHAERDPSPVGVRSCAPLLVRHASADQGSRGGGGEAAAPPR